VIGENAISPQARSEPSDFSISIIRAFGSIA
jgi:hypothetical protein